MGNVIGSIFFVIYLRPNINAQDRQFTPCPGIVCSYLENFQRERRKVPATWNFFCLTILALNPSFVIWSVSGLENSLYVFLVIMVLWKTLEYGKNKNNTSKLIITIAILSAFCALTRPDGILYVAIFPLVIFIESLLTKNNIKDTLKPIFMHLGVFILIFGSYIVFRYFYFGDFFPNTYYAKGGGITLAPDEWFEKTGNLLNSAGLLKYIFISISSMFIYLGFTKNITRPLIILAVAIAISLIIFILLPADWMPEFRFATPFFPMFYLLMYITAELFYEKTDLNRSISSILLIVLFMLFLTDSSSSFLSRSINFAKSPTVPFTLVAELYGHRFNEYAVSLGIEDGSILLPDVGGTLYYSHLKVYDLAGLTDKVIAQSLGNNQVFYDYVFDTLKPVFIHTHGTWAYASNFDADPRFRQDYIAINEAIDKSIFAHTGESLYSGDYVRKDSVSDYDALLKIQASFNDQ